MGWIKKCNAAIAPLVSFDKKRKLQFREAIHVTLAIVGLYKDRPYRRLKDVVTKKALDLCLKYERVRATERAPPRVAHSAGRT